MVSLSLGALPPQATILTWNKKNVNKGTKIKKETRSLLKGESTFDTLSSSTVGLIDYRPSLASNLYASGTLVETCSIGDRVTTRRVSKYCSQIEKMGYGGVLVMKSYVRMDSDVLPKGDMVTLGRMNNISYRDGDRELREYPQSPYSRELLPIGSLGIVHTWVRVMRDSHSLYLEESELPSLEDPNFYIVWFYEWLGIIRSGHYLIPVKETKKAEPREGYIDGIAIEPW